MRAGHASEPRSGKKISASWRLGGLAAWRSTNLEHAMAVRDGRAKRIPTRLIVVVRRRAAALVTVELVPRVEAVLADELAQVLAIDLRFARGGREVHLVAPHQV